MGEQRVRAELEHLDVTGGGTKRSTICWLCSAGDTHCHRVLEYLLQKSQPLTKLSQISPRTL